MQSRAQHTEILMDRRAENPEDEPSRHEVVARIVASKEMDFGQNDGYGYQGIGTGNSDSSDMELGMYEDEDAEDADSVPATGTEQDTRTSGRSFFDPWFVWTDYMDSRIR